MTTASPTTGTGTLPNIFPGRCEACNAYVARYAGSRHKRPDGWVVRCAAHGDAAAPPAAGSTSGPAAPASPAGSWPDCSANTLEIVRMLRDGADRDPNARDDVKAAMAELVACAEFVASGRPLTVVGSGFRAHDERKPAPGDDLVAEILARSPVSVPATAVAASSALPPSTPVAETPKIAAARPTRLPRKRDGRRDWGKILAGDD